MNNSIPNFCRGCLDRFDGLGYNPWIKVPKQPGMLIKYKLKSLENNSCKIYNPAATCFPNRNMRGINFTMGGEGDSYLYVNFTNEDNYNFVNFTVYIQCWVHSPPFCVVLTFVEECPRVGMSIAEKVSITIATLFLIFVLLVLIVLAVGCLVRQQYNKIPNQKEKKMYKYAQMD